MSLAQSSWAWTYTSEAKTSMPQMLGSYATFALSLDNEPIILPRSPHEGKAQGDPTDISQIFLESKFRLLN